MNDSNEYRNELAELLGEAPEPEFDPKIRDSSRQIAIV